jgi:hypothetical protein
MQAGSILFPLGTLFVYKHSECWHLSHPRWTEHERLDARSGDVEFRDIFSR